MSEDAINLQTLDVFLAEANLPPETGVVMKGNMTIESVLEEKRVFDVGRDFEKLGLEDEDNGWKEPCTFDSLNHIISRRPCFH